MPNSIFQRSIETDLDKLGETLDAFSEYCLSCLPLSDENETRVIDLTIAVAEMLNNVVLHACADGQPHYIILEAEFQNNKLKLLLCDDGLALPQDLLDPQSIQSPLIDGNELPEKGFGWFLVHQVFDVVDYNRDGDAINGHNRIMLMERYFDISSKENSDDVKSTEIDINVGSLRSVYL